MVQQASYQIFIYDTAGNPVGLLDTWRALSFERRINDFDLMTLELDADDERVQYFVTDAILEVWRRPEGYDWYREGIFFHRTPDLQYTETDLHLFISYSRGLLDLIHRREIRYTGVVGAKKAGAGESVILEYVDENAGPSATVANGRKSSGVTSGLTLVADQGRGATWEGDRAARNLLDVLQEISAATSVDFDITRTGATGTNFVFSTHYPQLGQDITAQVIFGTNYGNLEAPRYVKSRTEEITSVMALGAGSGSSRTVLVVNDDARIAESPWNLIEGASSAGASSTIAELQSSADEALAKGSPDASFDGSVIQIENCQYGVHYFLGSLVTVQLDAIEETKKIVGVAITMTAGRETIKIQWANYGRI